MSLSDLPDDILGLISCLLNGFDNCSLWMASDSKLKQRLVNNIITDFHIKYTIPGRYLWPGNFLKKLQRLSRLSLVVDRDVHHLPTENIDFFPIDALKYLMLEFPDLNRVLEKSSSISSSHFMDSTTSSTNKYINLNDIYPNLEHLELNLCTTVDLTIDFFDCLPKKLRSFLVHENYFQSDAQYPADIINMKIASLPRTLTEIEIRFFGEQTLDLSSFPPNLTRLATNAHLPFDQMIPKNIYLQDIDVDLSGSKNEITPSAFRKLVIVDYDMEKPCQLFQSLSNLEHLTFHHVAQSLDAVMTKCPPKLKELKCSRFHLSSVPSGFFGNHLTTLILTDFSGFSRELIISLPQCLTRLTLLIKRVGKESFTFFDLLPKNLKSFTSNCNINEKISLLPDSLTHLSLTPRYRTCDASNFDRLPQKLEKFVCAADFPPSFLTTLPKTLKLLEIWCTVLVDDDIVRMLPRCLEQLSLQVPDKITDASAGDFPPSLRKLSLSRNTSLTDDAIPLLPRSLIFLNLRNNPNFTDNCVKHLPRNLIELHFVEATKITSKSRKDLPKYLKVLNLPNCYELESLEPASTL